MTVEGTPDKPEPDVRRGSERRWVLTNRRNLIEFVSGMVIRPVEALTKYYTDPLELTPGAVPVLTTPVPDELVELAESSGPDVCFPVLIELPEKHPKRVPAVCLTRPLILHFRTEYERDEVLARSYDNADLTGTDSHVSPHLFTGGRPFRTGPGLRRRKPMAAENYERLDRFLGALTVVAMACGSDGELGEAEQVFSRTTLLPGGAEWFPVLRDWLNDKPGDSSAESVLFRSAVNVFGSSDPTRAMGRTWSKPSSAGTARSTRSRTAVPPPSRRSSSPSSSRTPANSAPKRHDGTQQATSWPAPQPCADYCTADDEYLLGNATAITTCSSLTLRPS